MCRNWIEVGVCRYGTKCQFAHGDLELMGKAPPVNNIKYKSKTCTTFAERLFCPYGQRCLFKHEDRTFEEVKSYYYVFKLLTFDTSSNGCSTKRLPVFEKLTSAMVEERASPVCKPQIATCITTVHKKCAAFSSPQLSF